MEKLAGTCRDLFSRHRNHLDNLHPALIQCFGRIYQHMYFYDLEDIVRHIGATEEELAAFEEAMSGCIVYKAATDRFMNEIEITEFCGLSSYMTNKDTYDSFYKTLEWNKKTGMIQ